MIALGIDPGARWTAFALIDTSPTRPEYLNAVASTVEIMAHYDAVSVDVIGVEWIRRPSWRVKGKAKPLDPTAILATGIVLGVVEATLRRCAHPIVRIGPSGNGRLLPLTAYPGPLATGGKGTDARRHERSAYDVAMMAAQQHRPGRIHT